MTAATGFDMSWYRLWLKQSQAFFDSANQHLREMFAKGQPVNPTEHLDKINIWLETQKAQWITTTNAQKEHAYCWNIMQKIYSEATDVMAAQWIKRTQENNPIKNVHELYDLWLSCCHEMYQKMLHAKNYHEAYSEFMNKALKFWESATRKRAVR